MGPEREIGELLRRKGLTLGAVESATGGLISHLTTSVPGSSDYFKGSVTSYSNEVKIKAVGVRVETLERYGSVSPQVAEDIAGEIVGLLGDPDDDDAGRCRDKRYGDEGCHSWIPRGG